MKLPSQLLVLCFTLSGCNFFTPELSKSEYLKWYDENSHNLVITKTVNDVDISVKLIPADLTVCRMAESLITKSIDDFDSLKTGFSHQIGFEVGLKLNQNSKYLGSDVMFKGVKTYNDYDQRVKALSFHSTKAFHLKINENLVDPVMCHFENNIGLTSSKKLIIVFSLEQEFNDLQDIELVWNDNVFDTGTHHFTFTQNTLNTLPNLNYNKLLENDKS